MQVEPAQASAHILSWIVCRGVKVSICLDLLKHSGLLYPRGRDRATVKAEQQFAIGEPSASAQESIPFCTFDGCTTQTRTQRTNNKAVTQETGKAVAPTPLSFFPSLFLDPPHPLDQPSHLSIHNVCLVSPTVAR
jgi:hypothetical protein